MMMIHVLHLFWPVMILLKELLRSIDLALSVLNIAIIKFYIIFVSRAMKHVVKILSLLVAVSAFWIVLLQAAIVPQSHTLLVSKRAWFDLSYFSLSIVLNKLKILLVVTMFFFVLHQLPIYFVVSLGCYGLLMVGIGIMQFPTCPQEADLLNHVLSLPSFFLSYVVNIESFLLTCFSWHCRILQRQKTF